MKKAICPYCDQPMESKIYCRGCRRIVLHAPVMEVDYYLNERRPEDAAYCPYHGEPHAGLAILEDRKDGKRDRPEGRGTKEKPKETQKKQEKKTTKTMRKKQPAKKAASRPQAQEKAKKKRSWPFIVLLLYVALMFGGGLLVGYLSNAVQDIPEVLENLIGSGTYEEAPEPEALELEYDEEPPLEDWGRSDEEVIAAGAACNGNGHFPVTAEEMQGFLEAELLESGYTGWTEGQYSYNTVQDEYSWYETEYYYDYYEADRISYTISLNCDTATGELHGILWYTEEKEKLLELADVAVNTLKRAGIGEEIADGRSLYEEVSQSDYQFIEAYGVQVQLSESEEDSFYYMAIQAPWPDT